jgi:hypothetical protein
VWWGVALLHWIEPPDAPTLCLSPLPTDISDPETTS